MNMTITTHSEAETEAAAADWSACLQAGDTVALFGDLGSGKTAFVRGLARGLGYTGRVSSPTFAIVHEYLCRLPLFHFDLYRIHGCGDLDELGWYDYLSRGGVCAVEWSERIENELPNGCYRVHLSYTENGRIIEWLQNTTQVAEMS
jgi:tRNA threonylcarbamoyladenosine biosynthesis protein TsaE